MFTPTVLPTVVLTDAPERLDALADRFERECCIPGKPAHVSAACLAIDRETCAEMICESCGRTGLECLPYHSKDRSKPVYRVLAWCAACEAAVKL